MNQLSVLLAMTPGLESVLLGDPARRRLESVARVTAGPTVDVQAVEADLLASIDVILGGWGCPRLDEPLIARMPSLRMVAHAGGSVRGIVSSSIWRRGIVVTSAAAVNAVPVAEFAFAAIVFIGKDVFAVRDRHRTQRGARTENAAALLDPSRGNRGTRIGVVGASNVGRLLVNRLHTLDCTIGLSDPYLTNQDAISMGVTPFELDDLCAWCDVLTLHAPGRLATRHLIGARQLAALRDGAWLVNTARGQLVDTDALIAECISGRISAFIDTIDPSPLPADCPLFDLPNVVLTPHIAGSMGNEVSRMGELAVSEIVRWTHGQSPFHLVHESDLDRIA